MQHAYAEDAHEGGVVALGDVLVLGLGKTGRELADFLAGGLEGSAPRAVGDAARALPSVSSVTLYGGASTQEGPAAHALRAAGVRVVLGTEEVEGAYDLAVVSPGISERSAFFASARAHARELIGEPELAWRLSPERWVAITGTNGKTTTTTLVRDLLRAGGLPAEAVGNIGTLATTAAAAREPGGWLVAELSSYQLATSVELHPSVAVLLNLTPDHLSWHGSLERYAAAKERIFRRLGPSDLAVIGTDDAWCDAIAHRLDARGLRVCRVGVESDPGGPHAAFVDASGRLVVRLDGVEHRLARADELAIRGRHNLQNALAAATVAVELAVGDAALATALAAFAPLEHRIEPCGELDGVSFVNDSKATNVDSVLAALTAFAPGSVVLLLGGRDKGTELEGLAAAVARSCRAAVCFGEAGPRMAEALRAAAGGRAPQVLEATHLEQALAAGRCVARPGDTVLLSPACASFDEFSSFEERGRAFKALVAALVRGEVA